MDIATSALIRKRAEVSGEIEALRTRMARSRSMRIATEYGKRLAIKSQNLKPETLRLLAETYSSPSFVIDQREAEGLFHRVREASPTERALVAALGQHARFEVTRGNEVDMHALSERRDSAHQEVDGHAADHDGGEPAPNGGDSPGAVPEADPAAKAGRGRGAKSIPPSDSGGGSDVAAATI